MSKTYNIAFICGLIHKQRHTDQKKKREQHERNTLKKRNIFITQQRENKHFQYPFEFCNLLNRDRVFVVYISFEIFQCNRKNWGKSPYRKTGSRFADSLTKFALNENEIHPDAHHKHTPA